jgi:predicted 3-demethylubiquinone-9 3-methyltransferase (glyoxalase superfamily)
MITPFIWYDKEALQAARLYKSLFRGSKTVSGTHMDGTPSGGVDVTTIRILGRDITLMSAGPHFKLNPSISLMVHCKSAAELDRVWKKLAKGGKALMELGSYPFSPRYGWIQDKYGLSWQLIYTKGARPGVTPFLMFTRRQSGKSSQAMKYYRGVFKKAPDFKVLDGGPEHAFAFNEAFSFVVSCKDQKEVDYYWKKLSSDPRSEQCGWCKDKFGVSWQVVPTVLGKLLGSKDRGVAGRVTQAFLKMKKFNIKALQSAAQGA